MYTYICNLVEGLEDALLALRGGREVDEHAFRSQLRRLELGAHRVELVAQVAHGVRPRLRRQHLE